VASAWNGNECRDPITVGDMVDKLKNADGETSLYRLYRSLALEHGKCLSMEISDLIYYPMAKINAKGMFVGDPGSCKSTSAISTNEGVSFWNSLREWGTTYHMRDYFDIDEQHLAVMIKKDIQEMFRNANQIYNCYLGDDIGAAWNSRLWAKMFNQILNAYIGTDRTFRTFKCVTLASDKEMDSQARNKFTHYVEMDGPQVFEQNTVFGKLFRIHSQPRLNKIFYPRFKGRDPETGLKLVYQKIEFLLPSKELHEGYENMRDFKARLFHVKQFKELEEMEKFLLQRQTGQKPGDEKLDSQIKTYVEKNIPPPKGKGRLNYYNEVAEELDCSPDYVRRVVRDMKSGGGGH
jgi:hypothetical protein